MVDVPSARAWSAVRDRSAPYVLPAMAFGGALLPAGPAPALQELSGLTSVPLPVQAVVVGVLAAAAVSSSPTRRWPLFVVAAVDVLARSSGLVLAVASYVAATTWRRPRHLVAYGVAATALATVPTTGVDVLSSLGGGPVFVWLPMLIGSWVTARGQVLAGLRERAGRLEQEQAARAERARAQERARIARDMHDVVAHRVSLMVLHAGALEINAPDERTAAQAELIRTTGKEALSQLRAVLGVLSEHRQGHVRPQPTLADLDTLLEQSRSAGVPVHRRDEGRPSALPAMVEHAAYRIVQEGLTNIHKYAAGTVAHVTLRHLPTALEVTVANSAPTGVATALPGSGLGLSGLRERVDLLGGRFGAGPEPDGGFSVSATIPT